MMSVMVVTVAQLNFPGCSLACAKSSFSELMFIDAGTAIATTVFVTRATGSNSFGS